MDDSVVEEEEPGCFVRVTGISRETTKDALVNFFLNTRRSGGGEIKDSHLKLEEGVADITFMTREVAERVVQKEKLVLDEAKLTTTLITDPKSLPTDKKCVHVSGISERTTKDGLMSYMEVASGEEVESVLFGDNSNAMVIFKDPPDFEKLFKVCIRRPLDTQHLKIEQGNICDCIEVSGLSPKTTKDAVLYYFENSRNGGGDVRKVEFDKEAGKALVIFEDHSVVDDVMKQDHLMDGAHLTINRYYTFLGETYFTNPSGGKKDRVVEINPNTLMFIKEQFCEEFDRLLLDHRVKYTWQQGSREIVLGCADPKMDKKTWEDSCKAVAVYINQIVTETITVSKEVWEKMSDEAREKYASFENHISIQNVMDFKTEENSLVLKGKKPDVNELGKHLQDLASRIEEQITIEKSKISEKIQLSDVQMELMNCTGFVDSVKIKHEGIEVTIISDSNNHEIQLRGLEEDVKECTAFVWQTLSNVKETEVKLPTSVVSILGSLRGKAFLATSFKNNSVEAIISFDSSADAHVMVTARDRDHMAKAVDFIKSVVADEAIPLDTNQKQVVESEKWKEFKHSMEQSMFLQVTEEQETSRLLLVGLKENIDKAKENIEEFFDNNVILNRAIETETGCVRFLLEFRPLAMKNVEESLKEHSVTVSTKSGKGQAKIIVSGTKEGIKQAVPGIEMLIKSVKDDIIVLDTQGSSQINNDKEWLGRWLCSIGKKYSCVIEQCIESNREEWSSLGFYQEGRITNAKIHIFAEDTFAIQKIKDEIHFTLKGERNEVTKPSQDDFLETMIESSEECASVVVSGLSSKTTKDAIQMYFENARRSHGGDVANVELNDNQAVVLFESPDVAKTVLEWGKHTLDGCPLTVTKPVQPKKTALPEDDESEQPVQRFRVVRVEGLSDKSEKDALLNFFENTRRSGGGEIEDIQHIPEERLADITFCSPDDAERVSQNESLKLDGSKLTITLKKIPKEIPKDPYKLHVVGISEKTTTEGLMSFMEVVSGEEVESTLFGSNSNAMVTFKEPPDIEKVQKKCSTRALDGSHLKIEQANICDCIEVTGLVPSTTEDTVFFYFDNPRNGGGEVKNVEMDSDDTRALVFFEDPSVVDTVVKCKHKINGVKLKVVPFYPCLGEPSIEHGRGKKERVLKVHPQAMEFINRFCKQEFDQLLQERRVKCHRVSGEIVLGCADTKMDKKTWEDSYDAVAAYINQIVTEKITVSQEAWKETYEKTKEKCASFKYRVAINCKEKERSFTLTGKESDVSELAEQLNDLKSEIQKQIEYVEKNKISKSIPLSEAQIELLSCSGFVEDLQARCKDLEVKLSKSNLAIEFRGPDAVVKEGPISVWQTLSNVKELDMELPKSIVDVVGSPPGKIFVATKLKKEHIDAVVNCDSNSDNQLVVTAVDRKDAKKAVDLIKDLTSEQSIPLDDHQKQLIHSNKWKELKQSIQQSMLIQVREEPAASTLWIAGIKEEVDKANENVDTFFEENIIVEKVIDAGNGRIKFICKYKKDDIQNMEKSFAHQSVKIITKTDEDDEVCSFVVSGTRDGIQQAVPKVQKLIEKVKDRKVDLDKPGIKKLFSKKKGVTLLSFIENDHDCIIERCTPATADTKERLSKSSHRSNSFSKLICSFTTPEGKTISLYKGDLTEHKVDVMVNAANESLKHIGGLAKSILEKGGKEIQDECDDHVLRNGSLLGGDVFVSKPGNLPCKRLVHAVAPRWGATLDYYRPRTRDNGKKALILCLTVANALKEAKMFSSIAIPAISAGIFGCPVEVCAKTLIESALEYSEENAHSRLSEIHFVDMNDDVVRAFHDEMKARFGKEHSFTDGATPKPEGKFDDGMKGKGKGKGRGRGKGRAKVHVPITDEPAASIDSESTMTYDDPTRLGKALTQKSMTEFVENQTALSSHPKDKMWLQIYAASGKDLIKAESDIHKLITDFSRTKEVDNQAIRKLSDPQTRRIMELEALHDTKIEVQKRINRIVIRGVAEDVSNTTLAVYDILNERSEEEHSRRYAELLAKNVQWYYKDDDTMEPYDDETNAQIEEAYNDKKPNVRLSLQEEGKDEPTTYIIDFNSMAETNLHTGETARVDRRDKTAGIHLPPYWDPQPTDSNGKEVDIHIVLLDPNKHAKEYDNVKKAIERTMVINIVKIERVQNPALYKRYAVEKQKMDDRSGSNEKKLFHGTAAATCQVINHHGFNRSFCGKNVTLFGKGEYFARDASYSMHSRYSPPDSAGNRYMYMASVLVGEYTQGYQDMVVPPSKNPTIPTITYDSVVDNVSNPSIFVVFHDTQNYPDYLITFR